MHTIDIAYAWLLAHAIYVLIAWPLITALITGVFGAADGYATKHPRFAFWLGLAEHAGLNARACLVLIASVFKIQPPGSGGFGAYRTAAKPANDKEDDTLSRKPLQPRHLAFAAVAVASLAIGFLLPMVLLTPGCTPQARQQVETDITNAAPDAIDCVEAVIKDLSGSVDIAGTIAHCGVTARNIYEIAAYLLAQSGDAGAADGAAGASAYDAHVHAWLVAAHDAMQASAK